MSTVHCPVPLAGKRVAVQHSLEDMLLFLPGKQPAFPRFPFHNTYLQRRHHRRAIFLLLLLQQRLFYMGEVYWCNVMNNVG